MSLEIALFTPELASPDQLRAWYDISVAVSVADFPSTPVPPYDTYVRQLRTPTSHRRLQRQWDARDNKRLLGTANATFLTDENSECAIIAVRVSARDRRGGVGTQLLRAMLPEIRERGCRMISGEVRAGTEGEKWTNSLGFHTALQLSSHHLDITNTDPARWQVEPAPGFRLHQWRDTLPYDLVQGFARARNAMADQPIGEASYRHPTWTVERVRQREAEVLKSGRSHRYVVAVDERSGTVAGFTEIAIAPGQWSHCRQVDTAVLSEFRGLGLGRAMKASMMRWLTADLPRLEQVHTMTATDNPHMIHVNAQLGYETDYTLADVEAEVSALEALLGSSTRSLAEE
jgi:GNAT superfamily N-acetyltransferase